MRSRSKCSACGHVRLVCGQGKCAQCCTCSENQPRSRPARVVKHSAYERAVYMVLVGPSGSVFVKALDFYRSQGGFREEWGSHWQPIVATGIEDARERACALPGARPYSQQVAG